METYCPKTDLGLLGCQYWYDCVICETGQEGSAYDTQPHRLGDCSPQCPDPIISREGGAPPGRPGGLSFPPVPRMRRRLFCQDVPCPYNPFGQPDVLYLAGSHVQIIADFEAEFYIAQPPNHYRARLFLLLVVPKKAGAAVKKVGIGAELDPNSPPSPSSPLQVPASAVKVLGSQGPVHAIQIDQFGNTVFLVATA